MTFLMQMLKDETWPLHQQAEHAALECDLVKGELPREVYREYLAQRLVIHRALEERLREARVADSRIAAVVQDHQFHENRAADDLRTFGGDPQQAKATPATRELLQAIDQSTHPALLGYQYVFEGSTNGAKFIARALRKAWELSGKDGTQYLDPYGEQQRALWNDFKESMDAQEFSPEEKQAIVAAAKATFLQIIKVEAEIYPPDLRPVDSTVTA